MSCFSFYCTPCTAHTPYPPFRYLPLTVSLLSLLKIEQRLKLGFPGGKFNQRSRKNRTGKTGADVINIIVYHFSWGVGGYKRAARGQKMLIVEHLLGKRCRDVRVAISENKSLETAAPLGCSSCNPVITLACDMTHGICVKPTSHPPLPPPGRRGNNDSKASWKSCLLEILGQRFYRCRAQICVRLGLQHLA